MGVKRGDKKALTASAYTDTVIFMRTCAKTFKALADETRLRIVMLLANGELCVCDLMAVLALPQSTVSRHLSYLRNTGWVTDRRQGMWMFYSLTDNGDNLKKEILSAIKFRLSADPTTVRDLANLNLFLKTKHDDSCR